MESTEIRCRICSYAPDPPAPEDQGTVQGGAERFRGREFQLWKCPQCLTIQSFEPVNFEDIYRDYPLLKRKIDAFARGTLGNLTGRLKRAGLQKQHTICDYGCGNGVYLDYLRQNGYENVSGYDPYVPEYATPPGEGELFDCVVNNDTIEHCDDVLGVVEHSVTLLKDGGILYIGTPESGPVEMHDLESHATCLHQPYHRTIITEETLFGMGERFGLECIATYRRSYHDTLRPFANYRFLDELLAALDHDLDAAFDQAASTAVVMSTPRLWFFALFGYFFPSAYEPAVVLRKPR